MKIIKTVIAFYTFLLSSVSFAHENADVSKKSTKGLTREYATYRASLVSGVRYQSTFKIDGEGSEFQGTVKIGFDLNEAGKALSLDFGDGKILGLTVNGTVVDAPQYDGHFLELPIGQLKKGSNEVVVNFSHAYGKTGSGLYRFKDPEDGNVYLYTDFEPYDANLLFPCFDQPDLKATYKVDVEAPKAWHVVSSTRETKIEERSNGKKIWTFPESAKFSTYLFSLHAGPYKVWESKYKSTPLRLFSRQAIAKYVVAEEWFEITRQGLEFYNNYFGYAYPFKKYDQLIVPDFNAGAMENVAAVTFSERFVPRGPVTDDKLESRASVILHEMAHMWFGDLVTMRWWDDLWLNESFATYMAGLSLTEGTRFKKAWQSFHAGSKQWAYFEDDLVTTHPIATTVPDTEQAFANFDGISYGKGSAVLKQLSKKLGPQKFRDGLRLYFKKYAFKNTTLEDFKNSLAEASKQNLDAWAKEWLTTAGLNRVEAKYQCEKGKVTSFELEQSAPADFPTLRQHTAEVGLFHTKNNKLHLTKAVSVIYTGERTKVPGFVGQVCPDFVYPNVGDHDYVSVRLDARSVETAKKSLAQVNDELLKMMIWGSLWDMTRDAKLDLQAYTDLVLNNSGKEKNTKILNRVLGTLSMGTRASVLTYFPYETDTALAARNKLVERIENFTYAELQKATAGSDLQKIWFEAFVRNAQSPALQNELVALLNETKKLPKLEMDQDRRWAIVWQLSAYNAKDSLAILEKEKLRDKSDSGVKAAIAAEAAFPSEETKGAWFKKIVETNDLTLAQKREAMGSLFPADQVQFREKFADRFFVSLVELAPKAPNEFTARFTRSLVPATCSTASVKRLKDFTQAHQDLGPVIVKDLRNAAQEDERCVTVRQNMMTRISDLATKDSTVQ